MLALLNIVAAFTRSAAFPHVVQQIAPDAIGLFPTVQATDDGAVETPATLREQLDFVKKALHETRPGESISLRAFVHLMPDELRAAHPRLSWGEIADVLIKAGFDGATADSVRQAVKSAPASKGASGGNEPPAVSAVAPPALPPADRPSGHDNPSGPGFAVPPAAVDRAGSRPSAPPGMAHGASGPGHPGQKPVDAHDSSPVRPPRMPWSPRPAVPSSDSTEQRPIERDGAPGHRPQARPDRDDTSGRPATVPPRAGEHRPPNAGQPGGASPRPIPPTTYPPRQTVTPGTASGFDRLDPAPRDTTSARQSQGSADRRAASAPRLPTEQPTPSPRLDPVALPARSMPQTQPAPGEVEGGEDEYDVFEIGEDGEEEYDGSAFPPKIPPRKV